MKKIYTPHCLWALLLFVGQNNFLVAMSLDEVKESSSEESASPDGLGLTFGDGEKLFLSKELARRSSLLANALSVDPDAKSIAINKSLCEGFTVKEVVELLTVDNWGTYLNSKDDKELYRLFLLERYLAMPQLFEALAQKIGEKLRNPAFPTTSQSNIHLDDPEMVFAQAIARKIGFIPTAQRALKGHRSWIEAVAYSPDGTQIVSGDEGAILTWDAQTGRLIKRSRRSSSDSAGAFVAFNSDRTHMLSGDDNSSCITIWDVATGNQIGKTADTVNLIPAGATFNPDGTRIALGSNDTTVRIWDAATGKEVGEPLQGHTDIVYSVAYSPDGKHIASGSWDHTIRIWDASTGELQHTLTDHTNMVNSVAYSPDGMRIVSASDDRTVRIWNASTGTQIGAPLQGHKGSVSSAAFSPDGKLIVSGGKDRTVRIWDTSTGVQIGKPLTGHTNEIRSVSFSPDGRRIASGSHDKTVRLWGELLSDQTVRAKKWVKRARLSFENGEKRSRGPGDITASERSSKRNRPEKQKKSSSRDSESASASADGGENSLRPADDSIFDQLLPAYTRAEEDDPELQQALDISLEDSYRALKSSWESSDSNSLRDDRVDFKIKELEELEDSLLAESQSASARTGGGESSLAADAVSELQEQPKTEQELMREVRLKKFGKQ